MDKNQTKLYGPTGAFEMTRLCETRKIAGLNHKNDKTKLENKESLLNVRLNHSNDWLTELSNNRGLPKLNRRAPSQQSKRKKKQAAADAAHAETPTRQKELKQTTDPRPKKVRMKLLIRQLILRVFP